MREHIVSEIRRLANENGGAPPGREAFSKATGITPTKWTGVYWARWGDALREAGYEPNALQTRYDAEPLVEKIAELTKHLGRFPTRAEMRLQRRVDPAFPNHSTVSNHFTSNTAILQALRTYAKSTGDESLGKCLPTFATAPKMPAVIREEGVVYLLKSGNFYKIGRSANIGRRLREITIALPEDVSLVHSIKTDDPTGIERYWHRRFADKRANGEWFKLEPADVKVFTRRTFQ